MPTDKQVIARWESRSGKHWVELYGDSLGYTYDSPGAGGSLGKLASDTLALEVMRFRVEQGYFLPDAAKTPMKRVR